MIKIYKFEPNNRSSTGAISAIASIFPFRNSGAYHSLKKNSLGFASMVFIVLLIVGFAQPVYTQTNAQTDQTEPVVGPEVPGSTQIILPEIIVNLAPPEVSPISNILPELDQIRLADSLNIDPQVGRLVIDSDLYSQLIVPGSGLQSVTRAQRVNDLQSVYTRGVVGVGIHQYLRGGISIYQLGSNPELRLEFNHETIDGALVGTDLFSPGLGFSALETSFLANVDVNLGLLDIGSEILYLTRDQGFQNVLSPQLGLNDAAFQEVKVRPWADYRITDGINVFGDLDYRYVRRYYGGTDRDTLSQYDTGLWHIGPSLGIGYERDNLNLSFISKYRFLANPSSLNHVIDSKVQGNYRLNNWLELGGDLGVFLYVGEPVLVPFTIHTVIDPSSQVSLKLSGGYEVRSLDLGAKWMELITLSNELPTGSLTENRWFGGISGALWPLDALEIEMVMGFSHWDKKLLASEFLVTSTRAENAWALGTAQTLDTRLGIGWRPLPEFIASLGWNSSLIDLDPMYPNHEVDVRLEFREENSLFGGVVQTQFPIGNALEMPILSLTGWMSLAQVVELELNFHDPLGLFLSEGRLRHPQLGTFKTQGFRAEILVGLSL